MEERRQRQAGGAREGSLAYVAGVSIVAALGGLLFGYDTAVISGAIGFLQQRFALSPAWVGWAASSALVGCMLGVAGAGVLSDRLGRKKVLLLAAVFYLISAVGTALPPDIFWFVIYRIIGGIGVGAASMTVADVHRRDQPGPGARPDGDHQPVRDRDRNPAGLLRQLLHRRAGRPGMECRGGLALDVRLGGPAGAGAAGAAVLCPRVPALALRPRAGGRGPGDPGARRRHSPGPAGAGRDPRGPVARERLARPALSSRDADRAGDRSGAGDPATGDRDQRLHVLCPGDFQGPGLRHRYRPAADHRDRSGQPGLHGLRPLRRWTAWAAAR